MALEAEQMGNLPPDDLYLNQLAAMEDQLGHHTSAVELKAEELRFAYLTGDPVVIGPLHHDLAVLLGRLDSASPRVLANYLASALIAHRMEAPTLAIEIDKLAMFAFTHGLPGRIELDDICALAEETGGVLFRDLLARVPQRAPDELQQVADLALRRAHQTMEDWTPLMTAVVLQATGRADQELVQELEIRLADLEHNDGSAPMVLALRRVLAGERGLELVDGLGLLPSGIVSKVLGSISELGPAES